MTIAADVSYTSPDCHPMSYSALEPPNTAKIFYFEVELTVDYLLLAIYSCTAAFILAATALLLCVAVHCSRDCRTFHHGSIEGARQHIAHTVAHIANMRGRPLATTRGSKWVLPNQSHSSCGGRGRGAGGTIHIHVLRYCWKASSHCPWQRSTSLPIVPGKMLSCCGDWGTYIASR